MLESGYPNHTPQSQVQVQVQVQPQSQQQQQHHSSTTHNIHNNNNNIIRHRHNIEPVQHRLIYNDQQQQPLQRQHQQHHHQQQLQLRYYHYQHQQPYNHQHQHHHNHNRHQHQHHQHQIQQQQLQQQAPSHTKLQQLHQQLYLQRQQQQLQLQQQQQLQQPQQQQQQKKKKFSDIYKSGKQKIMISLYNIYRNYPSNPPAFSKSPLWLMGKCYHPSARPSSPEQQVVSGDREQVPVPMPVPLQTISNNTNSNGNRLFGSLFQSSQQHQQQQQSPDQQQQQQQQQQVTSTTSNNNNNHNNGTTKDEASQEIDRFIADFKSILWLSYRKDFPAFENTNITTDIGWGCMVRTGQMLLARGLLRHLYFNEAIPEADKHRPNSKYRRMMTWFCDQPGKEHHYSIHRIVHKNKMLTKYHNNSILRDFGIEHEDDQNWNNVEEWFAPTRISVVLRHLLKSQQQPDITITLSDNSSLVPSLKSPSQSCTIFTSFVPSKSQSSSMDDSYFMVSDGSHGDSSVDSPIKDPLTCSDFGSIITEQWKSIIIMVPIKLGVDRLNDIYFGQIKAMLQMPQSLGIIGGKPKQSFYFVGHQDDNLIYLDPHFVHEHSTPDQQNFIDSYHNCIPQKMSLSQLDPSMAIGFYCRTQSDFEDLCSRISAVESHGSPMISIGEISPDYQAETDDIDLSFYESDIGRSFAELLLTSGGARGDSDAEDDTSARDPSQQPHHHHQHLAGEEEEDFDGFTMVQ
ncbi:hypothetical protein SAMD00019534_080880 [Acytostelium subglobosum LB1]|uniref:hypothetical protein n=1 Tax=Acytostelium subglobosum LB1 TaxID=1410327 RepID=UPI0006450355|nr:hypothetical protein SAMD00019534_080880 [Acytostelium subglobosum LB1]GAM24913.1 hypothetical protein SAMD00019534_080880 [Acytostelium subglobosum LB1]|eukprot:XP_012752002.1 hypothetical protein SAMD00019534_080880 [Acytostelium subglobosum LB1]